MTWREENVEVERSSAHLWLDLHLSHSIAKIYKLIFHRGRKNRSHIPVDIHHLICLITMKVKVKVTQSCLTLCNSLDYTVHGILQARILEWVAYPFSRGSFQARNQTGVSYIAGTFFTHWAMRVAQTIITIENIYWILAVCHISTGNSYPNHTGTRIRSEKLSTWRRKSVLRTRIMTKPRQETCL